MTNNEIIAELKDKIQIVVFTEEKYNEDMILDESESLAISLEDVKLLLEKARAEGNKPSQSQKFKEDLMYSAIQTVNDKSFEAGRQSVQKEIDDLKAEIERKEHLIDTWMEIAGDKQDRLEKHKEQVRKLIEVLGETARSKEAVVEQIYEIFQTAPSSRKRCKL